jgi:hypothetical protein
LELPWEEETQEWKEGRENREKPLLVLLEEYPEEEMKEETLPEVLEEEHQELRLE